MQDTDPYVRHPFRHALTLSFSRPVGLEQRVSQSPDVSPGSLFLK